MAKAASSSRGSRSQTAKSVEKSKSRGKSAPGTKKGRKAKARDSDDDEPDQESDGDEDAKAELDGVKINWNEGQLSEMLIAAIVEDREIKQGLYPPPGAHVSTADGGGKAKADFHRLLAKIVFENHPKYASAYAESQKTRKSSKIFGEKVKNRLAAMVATTKAYIKKLGKTGEGITRIEDVDFTAKNDFVNLWREIKDKCPWFLEMRELIGERPNVVPVGLGNSTSEIDLGVLKAAPDDASADADDAIAVKAPPAVEAPRGRRTLLLDDDVTKELLADTSESEFPNGNDFTSTASVDVDDLTGSSSPSVGRGKSLSPPPKPTNPRKRSLKDEKTPEEKTRSSAPPPAATVRSQRPPKKSKLEEFANAALAEGVTRQKELELALAQTQSNAQVAVAKEKTKQETERAKQEYRLEKLRLKHQRDMARINRPASSTAGPSTVAATALMPAIVSPPDDFYMPDFDHSFSTTQNTLLPMPPAEFEQTM